MTGSLTRRKTLMVWEKRAIMNLWNNQYPEKISYTNFDSFDHYLKSLKKPRHYLLYDNKDLLGWCSTFQRGRDRWFIIILNGSVHGKGLGRWLLNNAKSEEVTLNGWVIDYEGELRKNGQLYYSPLIFYIKQSFKIMPEERLSFSGMSAVKIRWTPILRSKNRSKQLWSGL